jgi:hypothetical protein
VAYLLDAPPPAMEKSRNSREKDESGYAKMRDSACEEEGGFRHIAGIEAAGSEEVTRMV